MEHTCAVVGSFFIIEEKQMKRNLEFVDLLEEERT